MELLSAQSMRTTLLSAFASRLESIRQGEGGLDVDRP